MTLPTKISLAMLQAAFKQHLTQDDLSIENYIVADEQLTTATRLAIYHNAYYGRLIEVLSQDYTAVESLLGGTSFHELCDQYIKKHPSVFPSLRWFGQYMPSFLAKTTPYADTVYLKELATFEWLLLSAFDAENTTIITAADIAQVTPEAWPSLTIKLHPSVHWFEYQWNILPIWKAASDQQNLPVPTKLESRYTCMVWRQDLSTQYRTLNPDEAALLSHVAQGANFATMCEVLTQFMEDPDAVPLRAVSLLKTWLLADMIVSLNDES